LGAETIDDVNKFTEVIYMLGNNFVQGKYGWYLCRIFKKWWFKHV